MNESSLDKKANWYFGNNRAKNLRLSPPKWDAPFFLTTSYKYAEDYSDYGVYKIELADQRDLNVLDFSNEEEVQKLGWPEVLVDKILEGGSDLNGLAYDLYLLASGSTDGLMYIEDTDEWLDAAIWFQDRSEDIFKLVRSKGIWGSEKDHRFLLQMWKDIYDVGFAGFTHQEFGHKILALFDLKCIEKISVKPVSKQVNEASRLSLSDVLLQLKQQVNDVGARCDAIDVLNDKFHHNTIVLYGDFHDKIALDTLRFNYTNGDIAIGIDKGWYECTRCMNKWRGIIKPIIDSLLPNGIEEESLNEDGTQYDPPYSLDQIKAKYPEHIYNMLANDPVHKWRADTGIELIHKEPTKEELDRIWKNWQLMPQNMKDISDKKSIEMFGCTNKEHYNELKALEDHLNENKATYLQKYKDESDVKSIVDMFWAIRNRLSTPQNDIDWWIKKPFNDLKSFVQNFDRSNKRQRRDANYKQQAIDNGAKLLDTKDGYEMWYVPTYDAMVAIGRFYKGRSAKWCVASDDPDFWFDNHEDSEFVVLVREHPQNDEFDKVAIEMMNHGRYYNEDDVIPWDLENEDWTFTDDNLIHEAWLLFKDNGETREQYFG